MARVLVIEDEPAIADAILYALRTEGHAADHVATIAEARARLAGVDLLVLDLGLPDGSGLDLLREVRAGSGPAVILLTARGGEVDRVVGLELGADDYVVKPFSPRELAARVRAVLRRARPAAAAPATATAAPIAIDVERRRATYWGQPVELSRYEFRLLQVLAERPGTVFSRARLLDLVWDDPGAVVDRAVDTHVKTLRAKLRAVRADPDPILTHRGEGYAVRDAW